LDSCVCAIASCGPAEGNSPHRWTPRPAMGVENLVGLVIALLLFGYLVFSLFFPERF